MHDIKRITRRKFTAEEKVRIVLEGFRRDTPIRNLCRREGIRPDTYYAWLRDFMEAGKEHLLSLAKAGSRREATGQERRFANPLEQDQAQGRGEDICPGQGTS
ncbi:transposase [Chloroflexota bacterium]